MDIYWKQRAHIKWLEKGDRNTAYFHKACTERRRNNRIGRLQKADGSWVEEEVEKIGFISNYFEQLFRSSAGTDTGQILDVVAPCVTAEMNESLLRDFTVEEIRNALHDIGDLKAPGPDGMPSVFFKKYWATVGDQVTKEVLEALNGGGIPAGWNDTVISLIPKVARPEKVTELRPISLCNVVYKIISKVLAGIG